MLDTRLKELFRRGLFLQHPSPRSLSLVVSPTVSRQAYITGYRWIFVSDGCVPEGLFFIALASGLRFSQLKALNHFPAWTVFRSSLELVSLAPSPTHLAKNGWEDHLLPPITVPSFIDGGGLHPLCPVLCMITST